MEVRSTGQGKVADDTPASPQDTDDGASDDEGKYVYDYYYSEDLAKVATSRELDRWASPQHWRRGGRGGKEGRVCLRLCERVCAAVCVSE